MPWDMTPPARARILLILSGALGLSSLTGCLRHENDPGQGGLTIGENKELDAAAAMLDARPKAPPPPGPASPMTAAPEKPAPAAQRPALGGIGKASQPKGGDTTKP